jgi:glycosyltransferase involved in cell wall biosynthesis
MLAGPAGDAPRLEALLDRHGLRGRAVATGRVPLAELPVHVQAADVVAHLRYPTARETSAALLRALAQGRATVVSDLEHQADLPEDAVLRADVTDETGELTRAILRLAGDPAARARLGTRAAEHVRRAHSASRVRDAWQVALERARSLPDPRPGGWPAHWPRPG